MFDSRIDVLNRSDRPLRRLSLWLAATALTGCNGISYPTSPTTGAASTSLSPTVINLVPSPPQLPEGGGVSTIKIEVLAGLVGVPNARVRLAASAGALMAAEVSTDGTGHAQVEWQGTRQPTITARLGELSASTIVRIPEPAIVSPPTTPTPTPGPPTPPTPHPTPTGTLTVGIDMTAPFAGDPIAFTAILSGNGVPFVLASIEWDFDGDGRPDSRSNPTNWTYAVAGIQTVDVVATAVDGRRGESGQRFTVQPADAYAVTLAASPPSAGVGDIVALTAIVTSRNGVIPAGMQYAWDFDGDGVTDATTAASNTTTTYAVAGTRTASVTAIAGDGRRVTASTPVTILPPALTATLTATPSSVAVGGTVVLTGSASNLQTGETVAGYDWDFTNDGTFDATTTVPTRTTPPYATSGVKTARVRVTSNMGRTATATVQIVVTN